MLVAAVHVGLFRRNIFGGFRGSFLSSGKFGAKVAKKKKQKKILENFFIFCEINCVIRTKLLFDIFVGYVALVQVHWIWFYILWFPFTYKLGWVLHSFSLTSFSSEVEQMTLHQITLEHLPPTEIFQLFVLAGDIFCVAVDCFLSAFNRLEYSPSSYFRRIVEFQWFLMALSVRPGSNLAILAHWLPHCWCAW